MKRRFKVIAVLEYEIDASKRSEAEIKAEGRFIEQIGDELVLVSKFDELEWSKFQKEVE